MALQASGSISFSQIAEEFGLPPNRNLGAYRLTQTVANLTRPLDDGIPTSGTISFSNFYSKRLNIVVYSEGSRIVSRAQYNANTSVTVIGGFRTRPDSSAGRKVWIHTNGTISSNQYAGNVNNRLYCSLLTGGWEADTDLRLDVGTSGFVSGAGGNGGGGGSDRCGWGGGGGQGTSAIGVQYQPIIITNRGRIQGGTGGGGGGGASYAENRRSRRRDIIARAGGGGGGGGMGIPGGFGGGPGGGTWGTRAAVYRYPTAGGNGSAFGNGGGGVGGYTAGPGATAVGGNGGAGGNNGGGGNCSRGGGAGASGFGIIVSNNGTGVSISGNGIINGVVYNTGPA
jgi:hypothetical protein